MYPEDFLVIKYWNTVYALWVRAIIIIDRGARCWFIRSWLNCYDPPPPLRLPPGQDVDWRWWPCSARCIRWPCWPPNNRRALKTQCSWSKARRSRRPTSVWSPLLCMTTERLPAGRRCPRREARFYAGTAACCRRGRARRSRSDHASTRRSERPFGVGWSPGMLSSLVVVPVFIRRRSIGLVQLAIILSEKWLSSWKIVSFPSLFIWFHTYPWMHRVSQVSHFYYTLSS